MGRPFIMAGCGLLLLVFSVGWLRSEEVIEPTAPLKVVDPTYTLSPSPHDTSVSMVRCAVGTDGRVERILETDAPAWFRPSVEQAALTSTFTPARRNGSTVASIVIIKYRYVLRSLGWVCSVPSESIGK